MQFRKFSKIQKSLKRVEKDLEDISQICKTIPTKGGDEDEEKRKERHRRICPLCSSGYWVRHTGTTGEDKCTGGKNPGSGEADRGRLGKD